MKRLIIITASYIMGLCAAQCQSQPALLAPEAFAARLKQMPQAQLLDVRTPDEYASKHLSKALNIDYNSEKFGEQVSTQLDKKKPVFVYCLSGGRSARAAAILRSQGFAEVYEMQGGIAKWQGVGLPLELTAEDTKQGISVAAFQAQLPKDKLCLVNVAGAWCAPCKRLKPIITKVCAEMADKIVLQIYDYDSNITLTKHFQIDTLPCLILYKNGEIVWRSNQEVSAEELREVIQKHQ